MDNSIAVVALTICILGLMSLKGSLILYVCVCVSGTEHDARKFVKDDGEGPS